MHSDVVQEMHVMCVSVCLCMSVSVFVRVSVSKIDSAYEIPPSDAQSTSHERTLSSLMTERVASLQLGTFVYTLTFSFVIQAITHYLDNSV